MFYLGLVNLQSFSKIYEVSQLFFASKCYIPRREMRSISSRGPIVFTYVLSPEGRCVAYPVGVQLFLFTCDLFGLGNVQRLSKIDKFSQTLFCFKMFYPPEGDAQHIQQGVQLFLLLFYLVQEEVPGVQNPIRFIAFFFLRKCFIPRREIRSISLGVHLFLLMFYLGLVNLQSFSKILQVYRLFFPSKCLSPEGRYIVSHQGSN